MVKKVISIHHNKLLILFVVILVALVISEGIIIYQDSKIIDKHKEFVHSKIVFPVSQTIENITRIQDYIENAEETMKISNGELENMKTWYKEMYNSCYDISRIYYVYEKDIDEKNYSIMEINFFNHRINDLKDILENEYAEAKNINDYTDINKYKKEFNIIKQFNSIFLESMKQNEAVQQYTDGKIYMHDKFNDNELFIKDYFYWHLYNDFFELLKSNEIEGI